MGQELLESQSRDVDASATIPSGRPGGILAIDTTSVTATPSVTPKIQVKDPSSGDWLTIYAATAITATGKRTIYLGPGGAEAAADDIDEASEFHLPADAELRLLMEHADTDAITYSVGWMPLA